MATASLPRLSPEQYLEIERKAEFKSEYFDGEMFAMSGGSRYHSAITMDLGTEINIRLRAGGCHIHSSDLRVRAGSSYTYPDLTVVCGGEQYEDQTQDVLLNPTLIVEVLPASTEAHDRGLKFRRYRAIESLQEYVLVSQTEPLIEVFGLDANDEWKVAHYEGMDAVLKLKSIGCEIPLKDIYRYPLPGQ